MLAVVWSFGFPPRFANTGGSQTRFAQTMRAFFPVSAALLGHTTRPENSQLGLMHCDEFEQTKSLGV